MSGAITSDTSSVGSGPEVRSDPAPSSTRPSGRKGNKKVRTGCITCKIRKVKCDEAKPSCLRCLKTGRRCDGYPVPKPRVAGRLGSLSPTPGLETPEQLRAFDYYRTKSAVLLGGSIAVQGDNFWDGLVVKLSATEPAVRHAVLALSNLHEAVATSDDPRKKPGSDFAFAEYGKAIAAVRNWDIATHGPAAEPTAMPLLVCILFICIEFLMDYEAAAQIHIRQGRLIVSRIDQAAAMSSSPTIKMVRKVLVPIYTRLSLASYLFGSIPEPIPSHLACGTGHVPMTFESLAEARDLLYHLIDLGLRFTVTEGKPAIFNPDTEDWQLHRLEITQQHILAELAKWHAVFTAFMSTMMAETTTSAAKATQDLMYLIYHATTIWISTSLSPVETAFDDHEANFAIMLSYASSLITQMSALRKEDAAFTFETELVSQLYWTAVKCRHPLLRRAALRLLQRDDVKRRRENLWRVEQLVVIASRVIDMEEGLGVARYNDDLHDRYAGAGGYWHSEDELKVPMTRQPTLRKPTVGRLGLDEMSGVLAPETSLDQRRHESPAGLSPLSQDTDADAAIPHVDPSCLQSPYGVPEEQRIKNALIGPSKPGGVWLTTFEEPLPGHLEWHTRKVFLKV